MNKCLINQCGYNDTRECNHCSIYNNVTICDIYMENNSLQLKPITNETFKNIAEFNNKLNEEINEFKLSINNLELSYHYKHLFEDKIPYDKENIIEEFYDVIQSMLQLMIFEGLTLEEIIEGQEKHFEKLESRGWKFNE